MESGLILCTICNIANGKRCIHCSVCSKAYHFTCISSNITDADICAVDKFTGFYWYCPEHRNITVHKLLDKLSDCEKKLMTQQTDFDLSHLSPLKKTRKQKNDTVPLEIEPKSNPRKSARVMSKLLATSTKESVVPDHAVKSNSVNKKKSKAVLSQIKEDTSDECKNQNLCQNQEILQGVPPPRRIFVSRLSSYATVETVDCYLKSRNVPTEYKIEKLKLRAFKDYTSFIINVNTKTLFDQLISPDFWPKHSVVWEFFRKRPKKNSKQP